MARTVTIIPQKINPITKMDFETKAKRRVAGYARVSTDSEEQLTSYEALVDYYTMYTPMRGFPQQTQKSVMDLIKWYKMHLMAR